jgi:hypothetical protein
LCEAVAATAVLSAKVAVVDSDEVGRSAVYSRYNNDPRTLPYRFQIIILKLLFPGNSFTV